MNVDGKAFTSIWFDSKKPHSVQIIDQRLLPFEFKIVSLESLGDAVDAIQHMQVRGAPLIGITAAYGVYLALLQSQNPESDDVLRDAVEKLASTRPTAVNLQWALEQQVQALKNVTEKAEQIQVALRTANTLAEADIQTCKAIGEHGLRLIEEIHERKQNKPVNILVHCNAGWLACVDWGTKTSAIYQAHAKNIPVHVWVDETRPRNQGARLTAWELNHHGVPHTLVVDNAGGHLMQHGKVDLVFVGADRVTSQGDAANKIGTYLKALAAKDNNIPFYVCVPSSTIDWSLKNGVKEIPIEERSLEEVLFVEGFSNGKAERVLISPELTHASNYGFDVTPGRLISGLITEKGICKANYESMQALFPEHAANSHA